MAQDGRAPSPDVVEVPAAVRVADAPVAGEEGLGAASLGAVGTNAFFRYEEGLPFATWWGNVFVKNCSQLPTAQAANCGGAGGAHLFPRAGRDRIHETDGGGARIACGVIASPVAARYASSSPRSTWTADDLSPQQRKMQMMRLQNEVRRMVVYREGWVEITKSPSRDCSWCPFRDMCELHEAMSDWEMFRDAMAAFVVGAMVYCAIIAFEFFNHWLLYRALDDALARLGS